MFRFNRLTIITIFFAALFASGCATMMQATDLSKVKFSLERISDIRLAGIDLLGISSPEDLNMFQMARATLAISREKLPLNLTLHLKSENPLANKVAAKLIRLDWTLILDGRETIHGSMEKSIKLAAGKAEDIPLQLNLNMFEFFNEKSLMDMFELALAFAGEDGAIPQGVALKIRPTIDTIFGPITYDKGILVEAKPKEKTYEQAI